MALQPAPASATTSSTLNFQARLETAAGAIVPDGTYNVEFKLYNASSSSGSAQGSCTGDANCLWTETRIGANQVRVVNGYLTVNLGSVTAFPGTINWNQQLYLTMNIGGTGGIPTWDGEMSPRIQLTAVPYAFTAGSVSTTDGSGNTGTLSFGTVTNNPVVTLPNASGTVCLQSSGACGFATGSGSAFLQGGNSFGAQGVLGTNDGNSLAIRTNNVNRVVIDTSGNLQLQQASTFNIASAAGGSQLTIQAGANSTAAGTGGTLLLQGGAPGTTGASGSVIIKANTNDSTTAFQVQNTAGSNILAVDTSNNNVILGRAGASGINGSLVFNNSTGSNTITLLAQGINPASSVTILLPTVGATGAQCLQATSGSTSTTTTLIFGACAGGAGTTLQVAYNNSAGASPSIDLTSTNKGFTLQNDNGSPITGELFGVHAQTASGLGASLFTVDNNGNTVLENRNGNNSTTAFQVENYNGVSALTVDTVNQKLTLKAGTDAATLGSELYGGGDFTSGWTGVSSTACASGNTGWNDTTTTSAVHCTTTANTTALVNTSVVITAGARYQVTFALTGTCTTASDTLTVTVGGATLATLTGLNCRDTYTYIATASTTAGLTFTPSTGWAGTVTSTSVSIKQITATVNSAFTVLNTSSGTSLEVRASSTGTNLFVGSGSGQFNTASSSQTTAVGNFALQSNTTGTQNTALGDAALEKNTTGNQNAALGTVALQSNTTGSGNAALGYFALNSNNTGSANTAVGAYALQSNVTGQSNTAIGNSALYNATTAFSNTAVGKSALLSTTSGGGNVGIGDSAGYANTTGGGNVYIGQNAGYQDLNGFFSTASGLQSAMAIGQYAQVQANQSIVLGSVDRAMKVGIGITVPSNTLSVSPLDYQTGTATRTNSSTTLVGTGTTWTSSMIGDLIVFADGTSNTVSAFTDATHITLGTTYTGTTDASPVHYRFHKPGFQVTSVGNAYVQNTSTTAFQVQNAAGTSVLTVDTSGLVVTVAGTTSTFGSLTLTNAHFQSTQTTAPTIGTPTSCATTPSASVAAGSTDSAGGFTITAGTGTQTSTCQVVITFNKAYGTAPKSILLTAGTNVNSGTTTRTATVTAIGTGSFTVVMSGSATVASTAYTWYYWVIQ